MNTNKITALAKLYLKAAAKLTTESNTEITKKAKPSKEQILKELSSLDTFTDRVDYAEKHLKHISSGSSRVIYVLDDKTVLKLAKNSRGVAQNKAESNPKMKSKYINKTLKSDKDGAWELAPYLDKVTEKEFEELTGINFKEFGDAIGYGLKSVSENSDKEKPKHLEEISKSDIYKDLVRVGKEFDLMPGDMERISSWGQKDGHPILLDTGLTKKIFEEFYESNKSSS